MKFSINKTALMDALSIAQYVNTTNNQNVMLSGVYIEAKSDSIEIAATNEVISVKKDVPAYVEKQGTVVVSRKIFIDIVKKLDDVTIFIETRESTQAEISEMVISCGTSSFLLKTISADAYPQFPTVQATTELSLDFDVFCELSKLVDYATALTEVSGSVFQGVLFSISDNTLNMVATDQFRIAIASKKIEMQNISDIEVVIPGKFLKEIASLPKEEKELHIALNDKQIMITFGRAVLVNKLLEGRFPNYEKIRPTSFLVEAVISKKELLSAMDKLSVLTSATEEALKFNFSHLTQTLEISINSKDSGTGLTSLACEIKGNESIEVSFFYKHLLGGAKAYPHESINFNISDGGRQGVFVCEEDGKDVLNFEYIFTKKNI